MAFLRLFSPGRIMLVAIIVVAVYLTFSAGTNLLHSYRLVSDEQQLQDNVQELQTELDQLTQIRDYLRSDEYVEFMARRVFGLVKPGEKLVVVQAPQATPGPEKDGDNLSWWQRLFSAP